LNKTEREEVDRNMPIKNLTTNNLQAKSLLLYYILLIKNFNQLIKKVYADDPNPQDFDFKEEAYSLENRLTIEPEAEASTIIMNEIQASKYEVKNKIIKPLLLKINKGI